MKISYDTYKEWGKPPLKDQLLYHNLDHCLTVAVLACDFVGQSIVAEGKRLRDNKRLMEMTNLVGFYHDQGHSGGKTSDAENIEVAVRWMLECEVGNFNTEELATMANAIRCTEFPFVREPTTLMEMAIRDADLLAIPFFTGTQVVEWSVRLYDELRLAGKLPPGVTSLAEWGERNHEFHKNKILYTDAGKRLNQTMWEDGRIFLATRALSFVEERKHITQFKVGETEYVFIPQP